MKVRLKLIPVVFHFYFRLLEFSNPVLKRKSKNICNFENLQETKLSSLSIVEHIQFSELRHAFRYGLKQAW